MATELGTTEAIRRRVHKAPSGTFFRTSEFAGPKPAVLTALSRLHSNGDLIRVRNGLYWKGVESRYGKGRYDSSAAAIALTEGRGVGPTRWTATQMLGLSTQVPRVADLVVTGPAPAMAGVNFHTRNNVARQGLSYMEVAVLEALRDFPRYAEVDADELATKVDALARDGAINMKRIEKVAAVEHSPRLRENLEVLRRHREDLAA